MIIIHRRDSILTFRDRWEHQYRNFSGRTVSGPIEESREKIKFLDLETCSPADIAATGFTGWLHDNCHECGEPCETLVEFEEQWEAHIPSRICLKCLKKALKLVKNTEPKP